MKLAARTLLLTILIAVVLVFGGVVAHGQRPQGGGPAGPMIIDFTAVGTDGKPVTELTAADLAVKVGGKVRTVSGLTLKKIAAPAGAPAAAAAVAAPAASGTAAPFFTNEASAAPAPAPAATGGRYFLVVVDTESLSAGTEPQIKTAIEGLLKDLTPADRVAFSIAPHDTAQIGFGTSVSSVRAALANLRGQKPVISNSDDATAAALCRTSETLNLIKALMQQAPGGDTPMSMVVIAGSLATAGTASAKASTGSTCNVQPDQYNSLAAATAGARVNMYVVLGDSALGRDPGLDNLAGVTGGGAVMRVANEGFAPRVLADASSYWVATLAPDPSDKPNQSQRVELKTAKEGVTVHTRPEAMLARPSNAAGAAAPAAGKAGAPPKEMVASSAAYTDLQLHALAIVQRGAGQKLNVLILAEPADLTTKITAMRVGFYDQNNKGGALDSPSIPTFPITTVLPPVDPGMYRMRVAATDAAGKGGAVDLKVDASLISAGPFKMSGLMLLAQTDKGLSPRLQFSEDKITAMFELYGIIPADKKMLVGFELADSDTGAFKKQFQATGSMKTQEPDKLQVLGEIPIADLPPGDYVIRAIVQQEGEARGVSIRTFRKIKK